MDGLLAASKKLPLAEKEEEEEEPLLKKEKKVATSPSSKTPTVDRPPTHQTTIPIGVLIKERFVLLLEAAPAEVASALIPGAPTANRPIE